MFILNYICESLISLLIKIHKSLNAITDIPFEVLESDSGKCKGMDTEIESLCC